MMHWFQAAELAHWGMARHIYELGLRRFPRHPLMADRLAEVLMYLGDWAAAGPLVAATLARFPRHPRAWQLAGLLASRGYFLDTFKGAQLWHGAAGPASIAVVAGKANVHHCSPTWHNVEESDATYILCRRAEPEYWRGSFQRLLPATQWDVGTVNLSPA